jgi:hypothetical protein
LNIFGHMNCNKLSEEYMLNIFSYNYKMMKLDYDICNKVIKIIDKSFDQYKNKICKIIAKYLNELNK